MTEDLHDLVQRTSGAQPWRRLFHAATGVGVVLALEWVGVPERLLVAALLVALVAALTGDVLRARNPGANALFFRVFRHLASPRDASGLASSTWYAGGLVVALAFFPRAAAVSGILVLALADPVASYLGRRWGKIPFLGGSLEGTLLFVITALVILVPRHAPGVAVLAALFAALAERITWPMDDNFTVPVTTAAAVTVFALLL